MSKHFTENVKVEQEAQQILIGRILNSMPHVQQVRSLSSSEYAEANERFNVMERQEKFIVNAVGTYEYYGRNRCQLYQARGIPG